MHDRPTSQLLACISLSFCHRVSLEFASLLVQGVTGCLRRTGLMLLRPTSLPRKGSPTFRDVQPTSNRRWRTRFSNYEYLSLNPTPRVYLASPPLAARATSREANIYTTCTLEKLWVSKEKHNKATRTAGGDSKIDQAGFTNISGSLS